MKSFNSSALNSHVATHPSPGKGWGWALFLASSLFVFTSCVDEEEYTDDPRGNFEALWHVMDEHYCFFSEKAIDWNEIHTRYARQINDDMTDKQLFEVLAGMLGELRDGHVNLYSPWDVARNWSWHEDYPSNYDQTLIDQYLGTDYHIASGMRYRLLDDNIGYLRSSSFTGVIGDGNLDEILLHFATARGLIIDLRENSGGLLTSAETLAARFTDEEILVGYMQHKTGTGHNDFSPMKEQRLKPSRGIRWHKPVVVLTNRKVFSAANEFVKYMRCCPGVTVIGDNTGGGAGLPFMSELPCGWTVRFSACPMYDRDKQSTEAGIAPDINIALSPTDTANGHDTIIEHARNIIRSTP